jgi:hypothetical protein
MSEGASIDDGRGSDPLRCGGDHVVELRRAAGVDGEPRDAVRDDYIRELQDAGVESLVESTVPSAEIVWCVERSEVCAACW